MRIEKLLGTPAKAALICLSPPSDRDAAARLWRAHWTRLGPWLLSLLLLAVTWAPALADDATDLINELMCPSDCVETLAICQMPEAAQMRDFVKEKVAAGWSKDKIVNTLVSQYGERILAAPPKNGFNLTAWITPFAAILGGGGLVSVLLAGWVRQRRVNDAYVRAQVTVTNSGDVEAYRSRVATELESYE